MANFPFTVGDSLRIGSATISASGNAVVLPTGTQVGNQNVATTVEVSTGGGPKITNLQVTSNVYVVLDDTAVDLTGGFIKITGTNFVSGCMVYVASTPANSTTFVSTTEVRAQLPATAAGTYPVYLVNPDGGTAIRVPGVTFSASPAWQTASSLGEQYDGVVLTLPVVATDATVYTLTSGSLPPGLSLNSNTGVISGTVSGVVNDTVYSFTITATDAQLQDSPRTFPLTTTVSDPYFKFTTLLLSGSAISANTVVRDSSTNNFNLTVAGDARASNFTPYGTGWSNYFDGSNDYLNIASNAAFDCGTGNWTIEAWVYILSENNAYPIICGNKTATYSAGALAFGNHNTDQASYNNRFIITGFDSSLRFADPTTHPLNAWIHIAVVRDSATTLKMFRDGIQVASTTIASGYTFNWGQSGFVVGGGNWDGSNRSEMHGYISNLRVVKGTAVYTANFTPATTNLTAVANTSLLTCHVNSFRDASTNNFAITRNGDAKVVSFNPFNITNTGVNGSAYFDGTGDYLYNGFAPVANFGTNDFTVEFWVYFTAMASAPYYQIFSSTASTGGFQVYKNSNTNNLVWDVNSTSTDLILTGLVSNQWYHIAVARSGTNLRTFANGILTYTYTNSTNFTITGAYIGAFQTGTSYFPGYISDFRVVKGTAVYTSNFAPLTQPLTAIANTQLLTLQYDQPHNNHTFLDSSSNQFLITRSGNATQGTFSPFSNGGWSNYYTGNQSIYANNAAFAVGTGNFTVELFYNPSAWAGTTQRIFVIGQSGTDGVTIQRGSGSNVVEINISASGVTNVINYTWNPNIGQWYHIALVRSGTGTNQTALYIDGVSVATGTSTASMSSTQLSVGGINWVANYGTQGYISNVRFSSVARVITVPTAPYTSDANTLLLTCQSNRFVDNSPTPKTLTLQNSPSVQAFSPFAATAVYNPVIHGGSAYFDGTGDALTIADNVSFELGGGSFTIEAWIYPLNISSGSIVSKNYGGGGPYSYDLAMSNGELTSGFFPNYGGTGWQSITTSGAGITTNSWYHIALVRNVNQVNIYVNGVSRVSTTTAITLYDNDLVLQIGGVPTSNQAYFTGYISNLRIIKGTAVYTANFTPPTAPVTATTNTSLLLNFTDAAIIDSTGRNVLETVADAKASSVVTKFTGGSMSFDGTGDWIITSQPPSFYNLPGNFTIEFWIYIVSAGGSLDIMGTSNNIAYIGAGQSGWVISWSTTTGLRFGWQTNNTWSVDGQINSTNRIVNAWAHIAVVRNGSTITGYVNGSSTGATLTSSTNLTSTLYSLYIGAGAGNQGGILTGYLSDIRITQGHARYTANFTAPTAPARLK